MLRAVALGAQLHPILEVHRRTVREPQRIVPAVDVVAGDALQAAVLHRQSLVKLVQILRRAVLGVRRPRQVAGSARDAHRPVALVSQSGIDFRPSLQTPNHNGFAGGPDCDALHRPSAVVALGTIPAPNMAQDRTADQPREGCREGGLDCKFIHNNDLHQKTSGPRTFAARRRIHSSEKLLDQKPISRTIYL
jgi:hypothetical protein